MNKKANTEKKFNSWIRQRTTLAWLETKQVHSKYVSLMFYAVNTPATYTLKSRMLREAARAKTVYSQRMDFFGER